MSEINDDTNDAAGTNGTDAAKVSRQKPAKTLPTDRIRFDKQLDILRAFAAASGHERKAVTGKEAGAIVDMADSTIAQITPFFVDTGLLTREKKTDSKGFVPSNEVIAYQKAYEWDKANAAKKLAPPLSTCWFTETLTPKLKFRPVHEKEAINDLGEVAVVGPDKELALRTIIEYLVSAGIVDRDGAGMLKAANVPAEVVPPAGTVAPLAPPPAVVPELSDAKQHQLWLLEILNAYPELDDNDEQAILNLIRTIKAGGKSKPKKNAPPAANE